MRVAREGQWRCKAKLTDGRLSVRDTAIDGNAG